MSNKTKIISLRLSENEFQCLNKVKGHVSLSAYIRAVLFDQPLQRISTRNSAPVKDHKILTQVVSLLGQSRTPQNLNQIARAINSGLVFMPDEAALSLKTACKDLHSIKSLIAHARMHWARKGKT